MSEAELRATFASHEPKSGRFASEWTSLAVEDVPADASYFHLRMRLESDRLKVIDLSFGPEPARSGAEKSWDDYDESEQRAQRDVYDAWLSTQVGSARQHPWGTVSAYFDERGGGAGILLRYL